MGGKFRRMGFRRADPRPCPWPQVKDWCVGRANFKTRPEWSGFWHMLDSLDIWDLPRYSEAAARHHDQIGIELRDELIARLVVAGITVDECGFTHLAYAPEIAGAMLRRQQAQAVVAARSTLVEGAVGMVEMALDLLSAKGVVELDDERRAAMVSNLMVVLCGERDTQPVVNTGTLYQ